MKRSYDYSKLKGRIIEKFGNLGDYANALKITDVALYNKLNNISSFKQDEILESTKEEMLDIPLEDVSLYFFTQKVGQNQTRKEK